MKMFKSLSIATLLAVLPFSAHAAFPGTAADAAVYNITVTKIEVCQDSACSTSYTLGSGSKAFDIAGATAGSDVGQYVDLQGIPLYQTWTHVRATLSTTIGITASGQDDSANACNTDSTNNASSHTALGVSAAGAASEQSFVVPNVGAFAGNPTLAEYTAYNASKSDGSATMTVTYPLTSPFTCKGDMPRIEVKFNTQNTIMFYDASGGGGAACSAYPMPPTVTITVSDP